MSEAAAQRYYIRYAILRWHDTAWFYGVFLLGLLFLIGYNETRHLPIGSLVPLVVIDIGILIVFYILHRRSYLEVRSSSVRLRYMLRTFELPFASLARVRKQPLQVAFQPPDRRRYLNRFVRRLAAQPAVYLRIDRQQTELLEALRRRYGPRLIHGADIVLPITDADGFIGQVKSRLRGSG